MFGELKSTALEGICWCCPEALLRPYWTCMRTSQPRKMLCVLMGRLWIILLGVVFWQVLLFGSKFGAELFHKPGQNAYPWAPVATEMNLKITFSFQILRCVFQRILNVILMLESGVGSRRPVLAITSAVISARNQAIKFIRWSTELWHYPSWVCLLFLLACLCFAVYLIKGWDKLALTLKLFVQMRFN